MASKTVTNADGTTKKVVVGSKADPSSKGYVAPAPTVTKPKAPKETVAQTLAKSQAMLDQTKAQGSKSFASSSYNKDFSTINNDKLKPEPKVNLTQPDPALQTTGLKAEFQQNTDTYQANLDKQAEMDRINATTSKSTLDKFYEDYTGETDATAKLYSDKGGVNDIKVELTAINDKIRKEQVALDRKVEELEKNKQGLLAGALQDQISDVERESIRRQADLTIIQQGIQGRYDDAKTVADRAVSAYLEKQTLKEKALQFSYLENKDLFNKSEQRAFESASDDRQRAFKKEEQNLKDISDLSLIALENGAPASVVLAMRNGKSVEDAIVAGAQYLKSTKKSGLGGLTAKDYREMLRTAYPEISSEVISQLSEKELEDFVYQLAEYEKTGGATFTTKKSDPLTAIRDLSNYKGSPTTTNTVTRQTPKEFFTQYKTRIGKKDSTVSSDFLSKINAAFGD